MREKLNSKIESKYVKQYILLLFSQGLNFGTALLNSILFAKMLTIEDYGLYKYGQNFLNLMATIGLLGIPYSASRLLVNSDNENQEREIIGTTTKIMLIISLIFSLISYIIVLCVRCFGNSVNLAIYYGIPVIFLSVLQHTYLAMLQGTGKAKGISVQTFLPPMVIFVFLMAILSCFGGKLTFKGAWFLFCFSYIVTHAVTLWLSKATLMGRNKIIFRKIVQELKTSGKGVYIGSLVGVASSYCINFILGYVSGMKEYAVYALAWSLSATLQTVPSVMGTVMFRRNAYEARISRRNILVTVGISIIAYICFAIMVPWIVLGLFEQSYSGAQYMAFVLGIATILNGLGDFLNRFIGANGYGKYIQNGAMITGGTNIFFTFILIWKLQIKGVIVARIIASLTYLVTMIYYYKKAVKDKARVM